LGVLESDNWKFIIHSHIITYGNAADTSITENIRDEIETMWNEPEAIIKIHRTLYPVIFKITGSF